MRGNAIAKNPGVFPRPDNQTLDAEYHAKVVRSEHTGNVPERPDL